jgi:hypothetical protein
LRYRLCGQFGKLPYPQPLFFGARAGKGSLEHRVFNSVRAASEGKVKLLTVPLSGRNGRFFLTEISNPFGFCPTSLYRD